MTSAADQIYKMLTRNSRRLLKLYFPNDDGPDAGLLINHLEAHEHVSQDFTYLVTVLSDDPEIDLTEVQGRMVCVELMRDDTTVRYFNGLCFEFALLRIESGVAVYQMVLRPWLALFKFRSNHFLFHNMRIADQTKQLFRETGLASHEFRLSDGDPVRTFSCQYDETDYNYLHRRWEEVGWHYWYEHSLSGHRLIICDKSPGAAPIDGNSSIAWHHSGGSNRDDKIEVWSRKRRLVSGKVSLSSFDFKRPSPQSATNRSFNEQGDVHAFEVHHYQDLYGFKDPADGEKIARRRMEQIDSESQVFEASGNHRGVQAGRWFSLKKEFIGQVFDRGEHDYFITSVYHEADNNFLNSSGGEARYSNRFSCVPRKTPWRPALGLNSRAVKISGTDTAIVIGPEGSNIFTDNFGRVRVRFHWDREGNGTDSSAWIRVATPWAGAEQGAMSLPRIGSEVTVQWLGGSPDRPIIVGGVYNSAKMPPWALPSQLALTGLRSRELTPGAGNSGMGRSNHLILDDTFEKIQAQLKSDHACSQLSLGHITRIENNFGRRDARCEGFELATNAWGVLRAGKGMLISTDGRTNAASHIKDMGETISRLNDAYNTHNELAESALKSTALDDKQQQGAVVDTLKAQYDGVRGKGGLFPELAEPHLVLSSPIGIQTATTASSHIASDQHTALTTGKNLSVVTGDSFFASIAKTFRLFVQQAGLKMVAAAGDIDIQALNNNLHILAKLNITHNANKITISAKEEVVINAAGSYAKFNAGGIEHGTNGKIVSHAATHSLVGPKSMAVIKLKDVPKMVAKIFTAQAVAAVADELAGGSAPAGGVSKATSLSAAKDAVKAGVGEGLKAAQELGQVMRDPLKAMQEGAQQAVTAQVTAKVAAKVTTGAENLLGKTVGNIAAKSILSGDNPLDAIAEEVKHQVLGKAAEVMGATISDVLARALASGEHDPMQALAEGVKQEVIAQAVEKVYGAINEAMGQIQDEVFNL